MRGFLACGHKKADQWPAFHICCRGDADRQGIRLLCQSPSDNLGQLFVFNLGVGRHGNCTPVALGAFFYVQSQASRRSLVAFVFGGNFFKCGADDFLFHTVSGHAGIFLSQRLVGGGDAGHAQDQRGSGSHHNSFHYNLQRSLDNQRLITPLRCECYDKALLKQAETLVFAY